MIVVFQGRCDRGHGYSCSCFELLVCWSARARMSQSVVRSAQPVSLASGACSGTCRVCCSGRCRQIVTLSLRVLFSGHGQHAEYTVLHNLSLFGASEHYKRQLLACVTGWGGRCSHERPVVVQQRVHGDALANIRLQKLPPKSVTCVGNSLGAEFHGCQKVVNLVCSSKVRHRGEKSHLHGPHTPAGPHCFRSGCAEPRGFKLFAYFQTFAWPISLNYWTSSLMSQCIMGFARSATNSKIES
jgi:hypothetical protein